MSATLLSFITVCLIEIHRIKAVEITSPPENAVAMAGSSVQLTCGISEPYNGFFQWRAYIGDKLGGKRIYSSPPFSAESSRFHQFGEFGLEIDPVEWTDAGKYSCDFLTGGDFQAVASIVVLDEPSVWSEPSSLAVGQSAKLACTVSFGGPVMNATSPPDTQGLFPHLSLSLGPMLYEPVPVLHRHELGQPGSRKHTITVMTDHVVSMDDINSDLVCTVSTAKPTFSTETSTTLDVHAPAQDVRVEPLLDEYSVGDVINCSANGWPAPSISWHWEGGPAVAVGANDGRMLTVREEMIGERNMWKCIAMNNFGSDELTITFNVTVAATDPGESAENDNGSSSTIALAIALPLVIIAILVVAGIIVFFYIRKRKRQGRKPDKKQDVPFISGSNAETDFRHNGGRQPPIYQPKPAPFNRARVASSDEAADAPLDRSGYADLGLGLVRQASLEALDDDSQADMRTRAVPRQDSTANRTDDWREPNARQYTNVPVHSADGDTDPSPFSPVGVADIAGGLRGSRQSLDRAPSDDRPGPSRGSNRSLNKSQDSGTAAAVNPRTRGRDAAATRGSNRSLNRSTDSSEAVPRRPPGTTAPHQADPSRPPAHPQTAGGKPRPAIRPPMPPKKPDKTVPVDDDGTEV